MNKLGCCISFIVGVAIGGVTTYKYLNKRNEELIQNEIELFKHDYKKKNMSNVETEADMLKKNDTEQENSVQVNKDKPSIIEYATKIREQRYQSVDYNKPSNNIPADEENDDTSDENMRPYVISPDDFGDIDDYETIELTFYADNILADDMDELVDVDDVVGYDALNNFGEYENDVVYVRNDKYECDYEIVKDHRTYAEVTEKMPHGNEV